MASYLIPIFQSQPSAAIQGKPGLGVGGTTVSLNLVRKDGVEIWTPESGRGQSSKAISILIFAQSQKPAVSAL